EVVRNERSERRELVGRKRERIAHRHEVADPDERPEYDEHASRPFQECRERFHVSRPSSLTARSARTFASTSRSGTRSSFTEAIAEDVFPSRWRHAPISSHVASV